MVRQPRHQEVLRWGAGQEQGDLRRVAGHVQGVEGRQRGFGHAARERTGEEDSQRGGDVQEVSEAKRSEASEP